MRIILLFFIGLTFTNFAYSEVRYFSESDLPKYVYEKLDVSTFRNSFGPKRTKEDRYFTDLGLAIGEVGEDFFTLDSNSWFYKVTIVRVKDVNRDGIEDIEICFQEKSREGTYSAQAPLLITQFSESSNLVALGYSVFGCESYAK